MIGQEERQSPLAALEETEWVGGAVMCPASRGRWACAAPHALCRRGAPGPGPAGAGGAPRGRCEAMGTPSLGSRVRDQYEEGRVWSPEARPARCRGLMTASRGRGCGREAQWLPQVPGERPGPCAVSEAMGDRRQQYASQQGPHSHSSPPPTRLLGTSGLAFKAISGWEMLPPCRLSVLHLRFAMMCLFPFASEVPHQFMFAHAGWLFFNAFLRARKTVPILGTPAPFIQIHDC